MEDLISRKALLEHKTLIPGFMGEYVHVRDILDAPAVSTEQRWIPVTERLPENFVSVLGYMPASEPFPPVRECYTVGKSFFFPALDDIQLVTHWMPLPEPPKEV